MTIREILEKYRREKKSDKELGTRFEKLMINFLKTDPTYANDIEEIWIYGDFPYRHDLSLNDTGIDIVIKTKNGEFWGVQCKCYNDTKINKDGVNSFVTALGKEFRYNGEYTNFSHGIFISTTDSWTKNAVSSTEGQRIKIDRLDLTYLDKAPVDWDKIDKERYGREARLQKLEPYDYQKEIIRKAVEHYKDNERGQLIMACGTGKTFTSLKIAEELVKKGGCILFCVPSIALLGQTLREWTSNASDYINIICVCSDPKVSELTDEDDFESAHDLPPKATTNKEEVIKAYRSYRNDNVTVIFSTYQSIDTIIEAQKTKKVPVFDLIICDEAHRTTGIRLKGEDPSDFSKVHNNELVKGRKRLYMTATPKIYEENIDTKGKEVTLYSMGDGENLNYGKKFAGITFAEAVKLKKLSDYRVIILTINEEIADEYEDFRKELNIELKEEKIKSKEIEVSEVARLIGCINVLSKNIANGEIIKEDDPNPMMKSVVYCGKIAISKAVEKAMNKLTDDYISRMRKEANIVGVKCIHIDGTNSAPDREKKMDWLKGAKNNLYKKEDENKSRMLSNAKCLAEGVDVPSLDSIIFLGAKKSQIDIVQSIGRVMRKAEGKKFGYVVVPIVISRGGNLTAIIDDSKYKYIFNILYAIKAHDKDFVAKITNIQNSILDKKSPLLVTKIKENALNNLTLPIEPKDIQILIYEQLKDIEECQKVIIGKLVDKLKIKKDWEDWGYEVATIVKRQIEKIKELVKKDECKTEFETFLEGLKTINAAIDEDAAIETLAQHWITAPIFDALFSDYEFVKNNPVSQGFERMINLLRENEGLEDREELSGFYEDVKEKVSWITNLEAKQKIIIDLYDSFFKRAFSETTKKLGIVYTPIEIVDFIIKSVDDILKEEFNVGLTDTGVNILDPFTGTGTFITRLLQSNLIKKEDIKRKYEEEIFANEIVLLAYYIAAVNIETTLHDILKEEKTLSFKGICLTDTFQLTEIARVFEDYFHKNSELQKKEMSKNITVIIGNPPYSAKGNEKHKNLEQSITNTYAKLVKTQYKQNLYDSYMKALRWSTDRLGETGVIGFVTNGGWLDSISGAGFRKSIEKEFSKIYIYDLRGNKREGDNEDKKKEGDNVFEKSAIVKIVIVLLIKNKNHTGKAEIYYNDIGDYLKREDKLKIIKEKGSFKNIELTKLTPNKHDDWLKDRDKSFEELIPLIPEKGKKSVFNFNVTGISTSRDAWAYNFSEEELEKNIKKTMKFYNAELGKGKVEENPEEIHWSDHLSDYAKKNIKLEFDKSKIVKSMYRPFTKEYLYYSNDIVDRPSHFKNIFSESNIKNLMICIPVKRNTNPFSVLTSNTFFDFHGVGEGACCLPLKYYKEIGNKSQASLFGNSDSDLIIERDGISDFILEKARVLYGRDVTKEDIFYYVYGYLHNPVYKERFKKDLRKSFAKVALVKAKETFLKFKSAGKTLINLHINYEAVKPRDSIKVTILENNYDVFKMKFLDKTKSAIRYNDYIKIENIPESAYQYVINGKSAIKWVMERYQVSEDEKSKIKNDPNLYNGGKYILDLLLSVIEVSIQTSEIISELPEDVE